MLCVCVCVCACMSLLTKPTCIIGSHVHVHVYIHTTIYMIVCIIGASKSDLWILNCMSFYCASEADRLSLFSPSLPPECTNCIFRHSVKSTRERAATTKWTITATGTVGLSSYVWCRIRGHWGWGIASYRSTASLLMTCMFHWSL